MDVNFDITVDDEEPSDDMMESLFKHPDVIALVDDQEFLEEAYSALTNTKWLRFENSEEAALFCLGRPSEKPITEWTGSFRYVGGLIAAFRNKNIPGLCEDYMTWYCCAMESNVSFRMREILKQLNWVQELDY